MRNNRKKEYGRKAALLLSLMMVPAALSGCQSQTAQSSNAAAETTAAETREAAAAGEGNFTDEMKIPYAVDLNDAGASAHEREGDHPSSPYFSNIDFYNAENTDSLTILPHFKTTQQTTWWSCGVSATQMVMNYYERLGDWNEETLAALRDSHEDIHMGT